MLSELFMPYALLFVELAVDICFFFKIFQGILD